MYLRHGCIIEQNNLLFIRSGSLAHSLTLHIHSSLLSLVVSVGKTSLMNRYSTGKFTGQYKATIGADFCTKEVIVTDTYGQRHLVTLQIWDTAGQERFQSLGQGFYRGADACLLVYDVTDIGSLENLQHWKSEFLQHQGAAASTVSSSLMSSVPCMVIANKTDKIKERKIPLARGEEWCRQQTEANQSTTLMYTGISQELVHFETSAKTAYNVEDVFAELARLALQFEDYKRRAQPQLFVPPVHETIDLRRQESTNSYDSRSNTNGCC
jgi:Ras-related protein Rab-7A